MTQAVLSIDLDAIAANWRSLAARAPTARTGAVVKADAYGMGVARVAPTLRAAGAQHFFVAEAAEGARLRASLGPEPAIHVFTGHMAGDAETLSAAGLVPMLNSSEQVRRHLAALPEAPFGVQLDTGMNRLGLEPADWQALAPGLLARGPRLIMSHLACADEADHPMNARQLAAFRAMTDGSGVPRSLAATGGILLGKDFHFEVTRPGIGLYGGAPFAAARPVATLSLPVVQVRDLAPGEAVGYGNAWVAPRAARIATVSSGYADGLHRALAGRGQVFAGDVACPLVGRVSMDLMGVDVTDLGHDPDWLDILCPAQGVDQLAARCGTIGYEILTGLGARYVRRYAGGVA